MAWSGNDDITAEKNLVHEIEILDLENSVLNVSKILDKKEKLESLWKSQLQDKSKGRLAREKNLQNTYTR